MICVYCFLKQEEAISATTTKRVSWFEKQMGKVTQMLDNFDQRPVDEPSLTDTNLTSTNKTPSNNEPITEKIAYLQTIVHLKKDENAPPHDTNTKLTDELSKTVDENSSKVDKKADKSDVDEKLEKYSNVDQSPSKLFAGDKKSLDEVLNNEINPNESMSIDNNYDETIKVEQKSAQPITDQKAEEHSNVEQPFSKSKDNDKQFDEPKN